MAPQLRQQPVALVLATVAWTAWFIHLVSLSILQQRSNSDGTIDAVPTALAQGSSKIWSLDWWFLFFFFVSNGCAGYHFFSGKSTHGYTITLAVYAGIAAVFATYRIQDLVWTVDSAVSKALLAAYLLQAIVYYAIPHLAGLPTVISSEVTSETHTVTVTTSKGGQSAV